MKRNKRLGSFLLETALAIVVTLMITYGFAILISEQFSIFNNGNLDSQAQQIAQAKINEINTTTYDNSSSLSEALTTVSGTNLSREVVVGSVTTTTAGVTERPVTVNVYKTGESISIFSLETMLVSTTTSGSSSSSSAHGKSMFTSSGTFTVPSSVSTVYVSMSGGGGGGGSSSGGGGAAAVLKQGVSVTAGSFITVTVGSGGTAATTGGTSSFGSDITCAGGGAGSGATPGVAGGTGGASGSGTFGYGGGSIFGAGGSNSSSYSAGGGYGGGGGTSGAGSAGMVLVEW
ncbi:MAG: hypothetical protein H6Q69_961 [Firmicutes bacterium]|nr:hypothetical protein [Bacillota bacterium]